MVSGKSFTVMVASDHPLDISWIFVQSRWVHSDKKGEFLHFGRRSRNTNANLDAEQSQRRDLIATDNSSSINNQTVGTKLGNSKILNVALAKKENDVPAAHKTSSKKRSRQSRGEIAR